MRGSVYYQSALLTKCVFQANLKKKDRVNPNCTGYQKVASFKTMESYRNVWNNFFNYLKEHWDIKNFELIKAYHVSSYVEYKIEYYPSVQYLQKISSALGKLEVALKYFTYDIYGKSKYYDFSIRQDILDESRNLKLLADNYHNRIYKNPKNIIKNLKDKKHKLAATIQLQGGARIEGVAIIKKEQLHGCKVDNITGIKKGVIFTKEKGGKEGNAYVSIETYKTLLKYFFKENIFKIKREHYYKDIKQACIITDETPEGSHGFRWNFAKNRMMEYAKNGYSYNDSLLKISAEMKHNRAKITEHYLGRN